MLEVGHFTRGEFLKDMIAGLVVRHGKKPRRCMMTVRSDAHCDSDDIDDNDDHAHDHDHDVDQSILKTI